MTCYDCYFDECDFQCIDPEIEIYEYDFKPKAIDLNSFNPIHSVKLEINITPKHFSMMTKIDTRPYFHKKLQKDLDIKK